MHRQYLANLNGLRAISVFMVMIGHAITLQGEVGGYPVVDLPWLPPSKFGVVMFFCISGVLITHLLERERAEAGSINVWRFYLRRALRIWPLYFLIAIPALALNEHFAGTSLHTDLTQNDYLLIFSGLTGFGDRPLFMGQSWSISIEETFYIAFPLMLAFFSRRALIVVLLLVCFSAELLDLSCGHCALAQRFSGPAVFYGCIAIGCLAYLVRSPRVDKMLFSPWTQIAAFGAIAYMNWAGFAGRGFHGYRWHALAYSVIIINCAFNEKTLLRLESRLTKFLGEISYGLYMYHVMVACFVIACVRTAFPGDRIPYQNAIVIVLTILLSIAVSKLSLDWVERPIRALASSVRKSSPSRSRYFRSTSQREAQ